MKKISLAITIPTAVFATTQISETNATQINGFEFFAGINSGISLSWYDIGKKGLSLNTQVAAVDANAWNTTSICKNKLVPFLEAEFATQYLMNNLFIGMIIAGGVAFGGKYTENGYKYCDSNNNALKQALNIYFEKEAITIAKQKYHLSFMPYIGYRTDPRTDIYVTCGLKMVATKYFGGETKCTYHPVIGCGTKYSFNKDWFLKFECSYVFQKKKKLSENFKFTDGPDTYDAKTKATVKHGEYVFKFGIGRKF